MGLFDAMPEPVQPKRLNEADIYRNVKYNGIKFFPAEVKDGKTRNAYAELAFVVTKTDTINKVVTVSEMEFGEILFQPPCTEADIKYYSDKYDKQGNVVGKFTPNEQIANDWNQLGFVFGQLGMALGVPFAQVKDRIGSVAQSFSPAAFKAIVEVFGTMFHPASIKTALDVKVCWKNSDKNKTSYLNLAKATGKNIVFAMYSPNSPTILEWTAYERKNCMRAKYTGMDNPPKGDNEVNEGRGTSMSDSVNKAIADANLANPPIAVKDLF